MNPAPLALYVHFPFCLSLCPYCDFVVYTGRAARGPGNRIATLVAALEREIELRAPRDPVGLRSVYLGGGTPSLMSPAQVEALLEAADRCFGVASDVEVTLEVNPGPDERGDLAGFRAAGVNRLSIGAQSMNAAELRAIGRRHSPDDVAATLGQARAAGLDNVSVDLLYDLPAQTLTAWQESVERIVSMQPEHVSAYALTLDDPEADGLSGLAGDHLPLRAGARRWRERAGHAQDEDRAADMYLLADELFAAAGLGWYEISNWAHAGRESRHNLVYWRGGAWEAVGPGAHAFDGLRTRRWNAARLDTYVAALDEQRLPPGGEEVLDETTAAAEALMLRLRTGWGVERAALRSHAELVRRNLAAGLLEPVGERSVRLSRGGRLLSGEVMRELLPA